MNYGEYIGRKVRVTLENGGGGISARLRPLHRVFSERIRLSWLRWTVP